MRKYIAFSLAAAMALSASAGSFVQRTTDPVEGALSERTIALWQSHGKYYDQKEDRWKWQRCRLFGTVEDLYTRSYVVPLLVPMLENAGAYVMMPRERDSSTVELIIDEDGGEAVGNYEERHGKQKWGKAHGKGFGYAKAELHEGENPFTMGHARQVKVAKPKEKLSTAKWSADIPETGTYAVYVSYHTEKNSCPDAHYTVHAASGDVDFVVDQRASGGTWVLLGMFPLKKGERTVVTLTNESDNPNTVVTADAVRIGGGMGNVARRADNKSESYSTSGLPRWAEAARYWLQWAGIPDSIYTSSNAKNSGDYWDDIYGRPQWVNYMKNSLHVPIDMVMAFHSDAGTTSSDETVGTLGIYYTNGGAKFPDGRSRELCGELANDIVSSVVRSIRTNYEPNWTRREMRDKSYIEARIPEVPSMLLELLSHQNFADMKYGLDPQFKFDVCRAVYKGILRYFADRGMTQYVVQPLPVSNFAIYEGEKRGYLELQWTPTVDPLESTAYPTRYIIEQRTGDVDEPFTLVGETTDTRYAISIPMNEVHSFRVIAVNDGGRSFPSEVLAAGFSGGSHGTVTVVNGFTRLSAPSWFNSGTMAGFGLDDPGVPFDGDLSYTGEQFEYRKNREWVDDDQPGFGASYADRECQPLRGNSFDFTATHGAAILAAGGSFVSSSVGAFSADSLSADTPYAVDLILGQQRESVIGTGAYPSRHKTFPAELQQRLTALASDGVPLLVSGAYVGTDAWENSRADESTRQFVSNTLGYKLRAGKASRTGKVSEVTSTYGDAFAGGNYDFDATWTPSVDAIVPTDSRAVTVMRYSDNQTSAAVAYRSATNRTVTLGFPFETILDEEARTHLMQQILNFFHER
jgi:hypothetical protein